MEDFEITMLPMGRKNNVTFKVHVYHDTDVVKRFLLTGGDKEMKLEKRMLQKQNSWKLLSTNFSFQEVNEHTTRNLFEIFHLLDEKITGNSRITFRNPLERRTGK
jgi:hypothetical protein